MKVEVMGLILSALLWTITNIIALVIGYFKFQSSYVKFRTQTELQINTMLETIEQHRKDNLKSVESIFKKAEDTANDVERRTKAVADDVDKKQEVFHKENNDAHKEIMVSVGFIKTEISQICQNFSYMSGVLDQYLQADFQKNPKSSPRKPGKKSPLNNPS